MIIPFLRKSQMLGMAVHAYNLSTLRVEEAGGAGVGYNIYIVQG